MSYLPKQSSKKKSTKNISGTATATELSVHWQYVVYFFVQLKALIFLVDNYQTAEILASVLELMSFCVEQHKYHMKIYIINKDLLRRTLVLMKSKHKFLALCEYGDVVISFFKA